MRSIAAPVIFLAMSAALAPAFAQSPRGAAENNSAMTGRLERLEEQIANLQSVVAAVETLAKNSGGGGGYSPSTSGGASSEQIRQLSEQIAELTQRLQRLEARSGSNTGPGAEQPHEQTGYNTTATTAPASGFEDKEQLPSLSAPQTASAGQFAAQPRAYGESAAPAPAAPRPTPAAAAATGSRALFDQAYGA